MGLLFEIPQHQPEPNNNNKAPLLFLLGELSTETKHALFDPIRQTLNPLVVGSPHLDSQLECLSSGHGWLLLLSRETSSLFFINPLTSQRINLPYRSSFFNAATFSSAPTSPDCVVFAIERDCFNGNFHIDTLLVGQENVWTRYTYRIGKEFGVVMKTLCSDGILYFVDSCGRVSSFDIKRGGDWKILYCKDLKHIRFSYLLEFKGQFFGVKRGNYKAIEKIYKLKLENGIATDWEEVEDLGGVTMFLGPYNSCAVSGLDEELKNKVFIAKENPESKCFIYNVEKGSYMITKRFSIEEFSWWYAPIWI